MTDQPPSNRDLEIAALKSLQADVKSVLKPFNTISRIKPGKAGDIDQLQLALETVPTSETLRTAIDEIKTKAGALVSSATAKRSSEFRKIEAAFISSERERGTNIRESNNGWRIGPLELEVDRDRGTARILFSKEVLVTWKKIADPADLQSAIAQANSMLEKAAIPDDSIARVFWDAYSHLLSGAKNGAKSPARVQLRDFYRELRVSLVRNELRSAKQSDKKLASADFPKWAFAFNLSRYAQKRESIDPQMLLTFETGSQQDYGRGLGVVVTPLESAQDAKNYCYIFHSPPA